MKSKKSKGSTRVEEIDTNIFYDVVHKILDEHRQSKGEKSVFRDPAVAVLASNTESKLRRVIQEGLKFAMHSKRPGTLKESDIKQALKVIGESRVYGHLPVLTDSDEGKSVRLADLKAPQKPKLITIGRHWLAIEGVQPMVPQNPPVEAIAAASTLSVPLAVQPQSSFCDGATQSLEPPEKRQKVEGTPVMCVLTEELSSLYERICASITNTELPTFEEDLMKKLFAVPTSQQILPYLIQFITSEVKRGSLRNAVVRCKIITILGKIVCPDANLFTSMVMGPPPTAMSSDHFYTEPYLYQLVQIAIACITTKDTKEEWESAVCPALVSRKDAAQILCKLCHGSYTYEGQVIGKVVTALAHVAENGSKFPLSRFGAITGLAYLGNDAFARCGVSGSRDLVAVISANKELSVDVKSMILCDLGEYAQKSCECADDAGVRSNLEELSKYIQESVEKIKQEAEPDLSTSESFMGNQFI